MRFIVVARQSSEGGRAGKKQGGRKVSDYGEIFQGPWIFLHAEFASGSDGSKQAQSLHLQTELLFSKASPPFTLYRGKVY